MPPLTEIIHSTQNTGAVTKQTGQETLNTPCQVDKLVNSLTNTTIEELAAQMQELTELTIDFGVETCCLCGTKGHLDRQVTLKDGKWGLLCRPCAEQLPKNKPH